MINKINEIIDEKEEYQLKALRLEAENKRMKEVIIKALKDNIIQWKKEYDILDSIIDMKDEVIAELKAENARLKSCLQEIKRILIFNRRELEECLYNNINGAILDLIVKAESEEE